MTGWRACSLRVTGVTAWIASYRGRAESAPCSLQCQRPSARTVTALTSGSRRLPGRGGGPAGISACGRLLIRHDEVFTPRT